ncbi:MAG: hypothetical protein JXQ96_08610 [Cyclobacteriaceae bacterium]
MKKITLSLICSIFCFTLLAQNLDSESRKIVFPDVPGYHVMKCDLHQHSVFSDGAVWPSIRVSEAIRDGLDAISITEHLEYQPHKDDIPHPDRNRSFELASESAGEDLMVISGSEITRSMPPGHCNAIFIKDSNKLLEDDPIKVFRETKKQGAFTFWNHPNWTKQRTDGIARLDDMHKQLIKEGLLNGIEVVNEDTYSMEALQLALDNNLTILGTSDIHGLIDWKYDLPNGGHRPITLVLAKEKTKDAIKEGLMEGRTVVWFNNDLIGKEEHLKSLVESCLVVKEATYLAKTSVSEIKIENASDVRFVLKNNGDYTFHKHTDLLTIEPNGITIINVKTIDKLEEFQLKFTVLNAIDAPKSNLDITLDVIVK